MVACSLCGLSTPVVEPMVDLAQGWAPYYRAVYRVEPAGPRSVSGVGGEDGPPRLSGVGFHWGTDSEYLLPAEAHRRFDDPGLDPAALVAVRGAWVPSYELPAAGALSTLGSLAAQLALTPPRPPPRALTACGFFFHDACWRVLTQATAPAEVDVAALWRVLVSVPCDYHGTVNWGHSYSSLYECRRIRARAPGGTYLAPRSEEYIIPSAHSDPLDVPELWKLVVAARAPRHDAGSGGGEVVTEAVTEAEDGEQPEEAQRTSIAGADGGDPSAGEDPFFALPAELRVMLLTQLSTPDAARLRLASLAMARTPLTQGFFRSRFWPERELGVVFDGFLLGAAERRGLDWRGLFAAARRRTRDGLHSLSERNRFHLWHNTVWPLACLLDQVRRLDEWPGQDYGIALGIPDMRPAAADRAEAACVRNDLDYYPPRDQLVTHISLFPADVRAIHVSIVTAFGKQYVAGLRFTCAGGADVEIGYITRGAEHTLPVRGMWRGFYVSSGYYGLHGLQLVTSAQSEFASGVGDLANYPRDLVVFQPKLLDTGKRTIVAYFDVGPPLASPFPRMSR
ncbi:hypothetical protein GGS23DRAFT_468608 [Durotheca rogersii]|uniref:uncharacterized protein n=1 Tax=Durotheca rogersii TaxID=419775 RepID=UPI002220B9DF|nr:uncharacterized protein GGS23DRAFT_468608 [Durotheca rogersii]KAI5864919.1 hypothetical protein GGS23DRAFT_468608 [Durotheca rogersii]